MATVPDNGKLFPIGLVLLEVKGGRPFGFLWGRALSAHTESYYRALISELFTKGRAMPDIDKASAEHEARAKKFVADWESHLLSLLTLSTPEVQARIFIDRERLVRELRDLLQAERRRGYDDMRRDTKERLEQYVRGL
jgi:hypothetical protein